MQLIARSHKTGTFNVLAKIAFILKKCVHCEGDGTEIKRSYDQSYTHEHGHTK